MVKLRWDWRFPAWHLLLRSEPFQWLFGFINMLMVAMLVIILLIMIGVRAPWQYSTYGVFLWGWTIAFAWWNIAVLLALLTLTARQHNMHSWRELWLLYSGTPVELMVGASGDLSVEQRVALLTDQFSQHNVKYDHTWRGDSFHVVFRYRADAVRYRLMVH